jgi:hypothetical protein
MWLGLAQFEGGAQQFYRRSTLMPQGCTCCSRRAKGPRALRYWLFVSRQHAVSLSHDPAADAAAGLLVAQGEPVPAAGSGADA